LCPGRQSRETPPGVRRAPDYLARAKGGLAGGPYWFSDYSIQLSRGFKALKVWMSFKEHGIHKYGRMIEQNVAQAKYLVSLIEQTPELELLAPAPLNIVCFRYRIPGLNVAELNSLNQELLVHLHESGIAVPSYTTLNGNYALRVANTNQRTRRDDFDCWSLHSFASGTSWNPNSLQDQ